MGKLGNIVAETLCFLSMFPCLPTSGKFVAETKFATREAKNVSQQIQKHFCCGNDVSSLPTCFKLFQTRETLFSPIGHVQTILKTVLQT